MSWFVLLALSIALLLFLLFMGVGVFIAFLLLNIAGLLVVIGPRGFGLFSNSLFETATSETLVTVCLFILMGEILFRSGSVEILFDSIDQLIGQVRGRLYVVVMLLATTFGALSGSAVAVASILGRSLLPTMSARGYQEKLSVGTILAGASLAPIIPPSLLAIVVGSLADVSISGLLIAGILPGFLMSALTLCYVFWTGKNMPVSVSNVERSRGKALLGMAPFLVVVFSVMGMIMIGIATPSESAATGVLGAVFVAIWFRKLSLNMLRDAVYSAVSMSAVLLIIVASAKFFAQLLSLAGATRGLVTFVSGLEFSPDIMFLIMMLIPFFICMFVDQIAFMLLAVPIYQPLVKALDFDPIWFWTLFLINLTVASLSPPFGYTLFALKSATNIPTARLFSAAWPIVGVFIFGMFLLWAMPWLVTFLPSKM
jgi:tripartite ATP-independent transporter DctM subunit